MAMLAEGVELVIGVDTHKHTHTAAVVTATTGAVLEQATVSATPAGDQQLLVARRPTRRSTGVGGREHRRLRRRPDPVLARPR
jgi:hypothetical protein